jgi:hypothetical protein
MYFERKYPQVGFLAQAILLVRRILAALRSDC